jgi:hypothetical protein
VTKGGFGLAFTTRVRQQTATAMKQVILWTPRRSQLDHGLCKGRHLTSQQITSSGCHRSFPLERRFGGQTAAETGPQRTPRSAPSGRPLLVASRLRPIRKPGGARPLPRRQPCQGDAGAAAAGEHARRCWPLHGPEGNENRTLTTTRHPCSIGSQPYSRSAVSDQSNRIKSRVRKADRAEDRQ